MSTKLHLKEQVVVWLMEVSLKGRSHLLHKIVKYRLFAHNMNQLEQMDVR